MVDAMTDVEGVFQESPGDRHVGLRSEMLDPAHAPAPVLPVSPSNERDASELARARLEVDGHCLIRMPDVLSNEGYLRFCAKLGRAEKEHDPVARPYTDNEVILNLVSETGSTTNPSRQPFSTTGLTLHTESSLRAAGNQPRFIALMCVDPGADPTTARTLLVPMDAVTAGLSVEHQAVLRQMRYRTNTSGPCLMRSGPHGPVFSFRDFGVQECLWSGPLSGPRAAAVDRGNKAISALLTAMYGANDCYGVTWERGLILIIDNQRFFHGRTAGRHDPSKPPRHLKRQRLLPAQD